MKSTFVGLGHKTADIKPVASQLLLTAESYGGKRKTAKRVNRAPESHPNDFPVIYFILLFIIITLQKYLKLIINVIFYII